MEKQFIRTINGANLRRSVCPESMGGCGNCGTSCQSACKTSCTVANQKCKGERAKTVTPETSAARF